MDPITGALVVGGIGSIAGGLLGAKGASDQAAETRQAGLDRMAFDRKQAAMGSLQKALVMYGPAGLDIWKRLAPQDLKDEILGTKGTPDTKLLADKNGQIADVDAQLAKYGIDSNMADQLQKAGSGAGFLDGKFGRGNGQAIANLLSRRGVVQQAQGKDVTVPGAPAQKGLLNEEDLAGFGPGLIAGYDELGKKARAEGDAMLGQYDSATSDLNQQAKDIEGGVRRFGQQRAARVKRDAAESLTNANQLSTAAMMSRGLGASSALTDAYGANAKASQRNTEDTLGSIEDSQIGMISGLASNRLNLGLQRASGRTTVQAGNMDRNNQIDLNNLNVRRNTLDSFDMSGGLAGNSQAYYPGVSPSGVAMGQLGQSLQGIGAPMLGYGFRGLMDSGGGGDNRTLEQMRQDALRYGKVSNN